MKTKRIFKRFLGVMMLVFILGYLAAAPPWAQAQIPRYINYQGKLTDADDNPVTGDISATLRIYDAETGGIALWTEAQTVTVTRGIFSILLGNVEDLDDLDFNDPYWYSVEIEGDGEMTPRQRLTTVAYAINADKLDGYDASDFLTVDATEGTTTGITVSGGLITAGANEDIELNPTGTGNIIMTIDTSSGDFKITDGTTNWLHVDNDTGNVTISQNLTVGGTIYGNIASTGGDSTFASITVTGASDLQGNLDVGGNADITGNLDVTGALTATGATTLSSALDMNSNIDLDYSGTSAALNVAQAGTGTAATFTGGEVVIGSDTANTYAVSTGELYVQGDLEVDGTIYGNITGAGSTDLSSLTVTGTSDLQGNVADSLGTYTIADDMDITPAALTSGGTDDYALSIAQTLNDSDAAGGSDVYRGIKVNVTETDTTGWNNVYLMDLQVDGTSKANIDNSGNVTFAGTVTVAAPTANMHAATKTYVDAITPATAGGWTDGGTGVYLLTSGDNVGIGTDSTGTYKLNVSGATNTTSLYINGALVDSGDLSDVSSLAMLDENETITGNWVNTDNPWADNEVVDALTISGGTIENTVIGAATPAAATLTNLTFENTGSATVMTFDDGTATDTLVYDSTAARELYFSGAMSAVDFHVRGSSPAVLSFGSDTAGTSLIYDPATDEIRFSRGTFVQSSRNLVKNASFEAFSAFQQFHDYDPNYATDSAYATEYSWDTTAGYQGGWTDFSPDDWDYVSGQIFQHSPLFFKTDFNAADIDADTYAQDFTEGTSAVRLEHDGANPGKISQVISGLKPSTVYSVGVKMRVDPLTDPVTDGSAKIDIQGEDGGNSSSADTSTELSGAITTTAKSIAVDSTTGFPAFGTILITDDGDANVTERIRYEGIENNQFLKCTRASSPIAFSTDDNVTVAPFTPLTVTSSTATDYARYESQFATDPKASGITIVLSAETGVAYFDTVQIVAGGTVPEYGPAPIVDTGDQTLYGTLRIGRASGEKGGILSVDKFVRTRGIELFNDDPGLTGATGGGTITMGGGGGIFPPGPGWNEQNSNEASVMLYVSGTYASSAPTWRDYKVSVDSGGESYTWEYMDNSTGWQYETGGSNIAVGGKLPTDAAGTFLDGDDGSTTGVEGVKIAFSSDTGIYGDTWWFNASNEDTHQQDYTFQENFSYTPGKVRIYVDPEPSSPYFNRMVFEDGATKVSLADLAGEVATEAYLDSMPTADGNNSFGMYMDISGSYAGATAFEVVIAADGTSPNPDQFSWKKSDTSLSTAENITGTWQQLGTTGVYVMFGENQPTGYYNAASINDKWYFNAYGGGTASGRVTSLNNLSDAVTLQAGSNIEITNPSGNNIQISATGVDGSPSNEFNTSMGWVDGTNTVSVVDGGGTQSIQITGFLENESDPQVGTISTNYVPKWNGTALSTGTIYDSGNIGIGTNVPTSLLHLAAGSTTLAPLKLTSGTNLTAAAAGAMEFDGTNLYFTPAAARKTVAFTDSNITGTSANVTGIVAIANGGTGASTAATARSNLGLGDLAEQNAATVPALTMAGNIGMGGSYTITNLVAPTNANDAATKTYVDAGIAGLSWKEAVLDDIQYVKTGAPVDANAADGQKCLDTTNKQIYTYSSGWGSGAAMSDGDRYIFKTNGSDEGGSSGTFTANKNIYELEGSTLITITPSDGDAVFVEDVDTGFVHTGSIWTPFTGASAYSWGNGLSAAEGTTINVNPGTGIQISGDTVAAKLNATSGLEVDANGLALADSIAGTGLSISNKILSATDSSVTNEINTVTDGANTTTGLALTMTGAGISTASVSGNTITITSTEVDGSTTNEINTVSADSGGATTGLAITLAGGTNASTVRSVDTVTINVDDAFIKNNVDDITSGTLTIQSTTPKDLIIDNSTVAADADSGYITLRGNDYTATTNTELDMNMFLDVTSTSDYKLSIKNDDKTAEIASLDESGNLQIDGGITLGSTALSEANLIDLTDGGETTLHTHAASAPTAHADTHEHDGADPLYWSELARADGVSTTISSEIDSDISTHAALTTTHGVSGAIVGTTDSQELTNKTITTVANGLTVGTTQLVAASGNIGIGTATPTEKLDVNGNIIANHIELRGSSPATITFGEGASAKALQFDPTTGEFEFSGGKLKQAFQNLVRNGSFESYRPGAWENHNTTWGTDMDIITDSAVAKFETRYLRILDSSNTSAKGMRYRIAMPDRLKGEDITISFWARCATGTETASIGYSYGASATDATTAKNISLTTTWQNFTWTFPDAVTDNTTLELYIYLYGAGVNNPNAEGVGTITGTATSSGYVYFDGATLVQGKLALDYGPTPILDTGNQILYGNLAIGADTDPTSGGSSFPTLYFGEPPTDFYYSGYGGWSMESGMIKYEQFSGYGSGRFMFNKPIRIYPIYTESWGAGFHLGSGAGINFADNRIDAYIEGKVEADGGFYGDGSNLTNIQGTSVQLNSNGAIVNDTGLKINLSGGSGLSITSNQLALDSTYSSGSAYDGRFVKDAGDTMTGKLIINESAVTNNAQALDINSTGIMASATNKTIASISDSAAHTTTGTITGLEVDFSGGTYTNATARGINIQMKAASDRAINTNAEIKGATLTDGTASISSGALTGLTNATVDDSGTLTFKDASGNTIMQLVESTRTAQIYNLNVNGTTTTINTTTTDADHLTLSPGAVGTTAINIVPNQGITLSGNLITAKKVSTGDNVFVIDKDGNITTVGNVDGIDVSSLATAAVANDVSTIATGDQIYDFVIGLGYITDGNTNWDNSYGYITASDTLTGLVRSTESGASYITGGKVGIGMTSPTADLTVKGNLTTALTNTATSSGALVTCTAHGLAVGDAVKMPTGAASANEIFTIIEPVAANTFTVDSTPTNDLGTATTIYKDSNLLLVQSGDGVSMLTLDKSGDLTVEGTINATVEGTSSNANLLDQKNSTQFLRSDINDSVDSNATLNIDAGSTLSIDGNWDIGGTGVTPTAAEINILDGGLSAAELDSDLLTAAEGNSSYVAVGGDTMTGGLIMSGAAVSVDAGQNLNMEGSAGDSYMQYNSTNGRLEVFVDGDIVAYFDN